MSETDLTKLKPSTDSSSKLIPPVTLTKGADKLKKLPPKTTPNAATKVKKTNLNPASMTPSSSGNDLSSLANTKKIASTNSIVSAAQADEDKERLFGSSILLAINIGNPALDVPIVIEDTVAWLLNHEYPLELVLNGDAPEKSVEKAIRKYESKPGTPVFTDKSDPRVVAAVLKNYLESLPEPVILSSLYYEFNSNATTKLVTVLDKLPQENKSLLRRLLDLMRHWRYKQPADSNFYEIAKFFRPVILRSQGDVSRDQFMVIAVLQYLIQEVDSTDEDSFMGCLHEPQLPILFPGEKIIHREYRVSWGEIPIVGGNLWLTNFRLFYENAVRIENKKVNNTDFVGPWLSWVPLTAINSQEWVGHTTTPRSNRPKAISLKLHCKDFQTRTFEFDATPSLQLFITHCQRMCTNISQLFAFHNKRDFGDSIGWDVYDAEREWRRQGFMGNEGQWKISTINSQYKLCYSYPSKIIVPANITDDDLKRFSRCRSRNRFPLVSWRNSRRETYLLRADEPDYTYDLVNSGDVSKKRFDDMKLLETVLECSSTSFLCMVDPGEPRTYEAGYPGVKTEFFKLPNHKEMTDLFNTYQYTPLINGAANKNRPIELSNNQWTDVMLKLLDAALQTSKLLERGSVVLTHPVNNDTDFIIASLTLILCDGYYRTLEGFEVLIEKEWIAHGFPFARSLGHLKSDDALANEKSPIFLQFVEALWQLMLQFPRHFEFNERFLMFLLDEMYSSQFGSFLCNNDRDRELLKAITPSVWQSVNHAPEDFINPFYRETSRDSQLEPVIDLNNYKVWNEYYLRYNQRAKRQLKKMNYHMANNGISNPQLEFAGAELFSLPIEVLRYNALQELNMARNQLNRLPYHLIYMTTIRSLILSHNPIFHIHEEYMAMLAQSLIGLQELNLNFTKLKVLPKAITKFPSLRILRVRNNNLSELPASIERLANLEVLDARCNKINSLPKGFSKLKNLRVLGLGTNCLSSFPDDFFQMNSLEVLDLSKNDFSQIPDRIGELSGLVKLLMGSQRLDYISPKIGDLTKLEVLSLEECSLSELPAEIGKLHNMNKLILSTNKLTTLPAEFNNFGQIEELKLDGNVLHVIPDCVTQMRTLKRLYIDNSFLDELHQDIGNLVNLEELTVSKNKIVTLANVHSLGQLTKLKLLSLKDNGLTALPSTLGILSETLERLELEGNKLNYPPHLKDKDAILKHLTDMLDGTRPCFRMKLMLVGQENVGKTSLLGALKKTKKNTVQAVTKVAVKPPLSTDGIDIENWSFQINTPNLRPSTNTVTLSVWDFAGQEIYYTTHQFFLSARAIYLVVWNLAQDEELSKVEFWLQSVKSRVSSAPIVLVGTHLDCLPKDVNVKTVIAKLQSKYKKRFPNIKTIAVVSTLTGKNISQLKSDIERIVAQQSHMGEELPQSYLLLEELVEKERSKRSPPTIAWDEYALLAKSCNIRSEESLKRATRFLHETGSLIYFEEEESLNKIVILDPQYLTKFMSSIITTKHNFAREGILYHIHLKQIWRPPEFPEYLHKQFIALFEKFEISFNLTAARYRKKLIEEGVNSSQEPDFYKDGQSLIPALLPEKRPVELETLWPRFIDGPQYGRRFSFSFIPQGFFSRLMVRLLHFCETNIYWRNGILIQTPDKREAMLVEVFPHIKVLDVTVRAAGEVNLYRDVIATIETLIRIFKINVNLQVPCIHCMREKTFNPFYFPKEQCEEAAMKGSFVYCHSVRPIRIENLVPDLSMTYFEGKKIEFSEIELAEKIGEGGAAVVFRGKWNANHVAVKKLRIKAEDMIGMSLDEDTLSKAFAEFRREVWIMSSLSHPCIVQLKGLVMDPLCVVTEFLAGGNLYEFIHDVREGSESNDISNKVNEISWPLRIKIALDMAAGLEFLHSSHPPIIHRDLKSPNVLLIHKTNEERENAPIVAKVTDFGLSGLAPTLAGREVDNPVWLAPEVLREEEYTEKADVYSFGVILYELLTRQQYFGDFKFLSDIEEKIIAGIRPAIPEGPEYQRVPEYIQVIKDCWVGDSTKRPTLEQVYKRLRDIRDKYFPEVLLPPAPITDREKSEPMLQLVAPVRENTDLDTRSSSQFLGRLDTELNLDAGITSLVKVQMPSGEVEVWVGATNGSISVWSSRGTFTKSFKAHSNRVHLMLFTGTHVWSAAADGSLAAWNITNKDKESFWKSSDGEEVLSLTLLSTNKHILAGTSFGKLRLYNAKKCKLKKEVKLPKEIVLHSINSLLEVKEQGHIWLGSDRMIVRITNKFKFVDIFEAHQGIITSMLVVGEQVWTASSDSNIIVWNNGVRCDQVRTMSGHSDPVNLLLAVGNNVWSCSDDKSLIIWSAKSCEMLNELCFEHNDAVLGMAVLVEKQEGRDVNIVWSGSVDRTICLWADLDSSEPEPGKDAGTHSPNPQASPLLSPIPNPQGLSASSRSNSLSEQN